MTSLAGLVDGCRVRLFRSPANWAIRAVFVFPGDVERLLRLSAYHQSSVVGHARASAW
jgi:hypothetical protein